MHTLCVVEVCVNGAALLFELPVRISLPQWNARVTKSLRLLKKHSRKQAPVPPTKGFR